uniref:Uncharacterized protein n=1 Tax=Setaria italica TaxID=4555 RepID=K4AI00_SETIT
MKALHNSLITIKRLARRFTICSYHLSTLGRIKPPSHLSSSDQLPSKEGSQK